MSRKLDYLHGWHIREDFAGPVTGRWRARRMLRAITGA